MNPDDLFILDTFRINQIENPLLLLHIQRTFEAVCFYHPHLNKDAIIKIYQPYRVTKSNTPQKCRLIIDPRSMKLIQSEVTDIDIINSKIRLELATHQNQAAGRGLQNYKTNNRKYWDDNLSLCWPGIDDVIGINTHHHLTETSRFNLFIKIHDQVFTPNLDTGCVNGCLRRSALANGFVEISHKKYPLFEKDFFSDDLKNAEIYVGNSLRGITKATLKL